MLPIETVAVVGATETGSTCALLAALAGCAVRLFDPSEAALDHAFSRIRRRVELALASGVITRSERQRTLDDLLFTPDLDEALTGADLTVDAADASGPELHARLAAALRATTAVAAAGAASPAEIAAHLPQPGRVLALRLHDVQGPVPRLDVVAAPGTSPHVLERAEAFAARVNRAARTPSAGAPHGGPADRGDRA
jgi:3-hydroxyacyl-CoA dehydrogenase